MRRPSLKVNDVCSSLLRPASLWEGSGLGGGGPDLPGAGLLRPPVRGGRPAEQSGGEGVVCRPLRGAQEGRLLSRGEEAPG